MHLKLHKILLLKIRLCIDFHTFKIIGANIVSMNMSEIQKLATPRNERQLDLVSAASGHGGGYCCDTGVDLPTLLALLAGIA